VEVSQRALSPTASIDLSGFVDTVHSSGSIDRTNPFFQTLGTNQRTCETCHAASQGWTITALNADLLFLTSQGLDPLFMIHDTGSRPDADISTLQARLAAFGPTVLTRALIRFTRNISPTAEFAVTAVDDPSGFSTLTQVLAFRRPSPTANQSKVSSTGWNGGNPGADVGAAVQATGVGATRGHEQRPDPLPADIAASMKDFQLGIAVAQTFDFFAGDLTANGAKGGPANLLAQPFYLGINDIQGNDPMGHPFNRKVFDLYDAWSVYETSHDQSFVGKARAAIYRGQELFNFFEFDISGVPGLNDLLNQTTVRGTCSTCHNSPNVGGHSVFRVFDVGTADEPRCSPTLPLITLQNKMTMATRKVCDLARGQTTGLWTDVGRFRAPPLRALAARPPYFHDGQAATLNSVVDYFNTRFNIGFSSQQKSDLVAFLKAL
jgi:hypothetical protein